MIASLAEANDLEDIIDSCIFANDNNIDKQMKKEVFNFHVQNLAYGWCRVLMRINNQEISFNGEFMGPNPLASFIEVCADIVIDGDDYDGSHIKWIDRNYILDIEINMDVKEILHLDIIKKKEDHFSEEYKEIVLDEWHETIPKDVFISVVTAEGYRVLNAFGLYGYYSSWQGDAEFPIAKLLRISGLNNKIKKGDSTCTSITEELEFIQNQLSELDIKEETKIKECIIYYESWQIQCCGEPFSVGDKIEWTCRMPYETKNAHGVIIDFEEEHHGFPTHTITGSVSKIIAERSEFPKGLRQVWYDKADIIREELQTADGWESDIKEDDTTDRTFWGYVVELKDAIVKPIEKEDNGDNHK